MLHICLLTFHLYSSPWYKGIEFDTTKRGTNYVSARSGFEKKQKNKGNDEMKLNNENVKRGAKRLSLEFCSSALKCFFVISDLESQNSPPYFDHLGY